MVLADMPQFLLDANISIETAEFLRSDGYTVTTVAEVGLGRADDSLIASFAQEHAYILITFDLDFGYIFHSTNSHSMGIIILRLENQTVESVNPILQRLLSSEIFDNKRNQESLIVVSEMRLRIHH